VPFAGMDRSSLYDLHDVQTYYDESIRKYVCSALFALLLLERSIICLHLRILLSKCEWGNRYGPF
jgi:hypothetical protein